MTDLNEHQLEALEKMRHEFQNHNGHGMPLDDSTFLRYLRARSYHFDKASHLLKSTLEWRRSFDLDGLHAGHWAETIEKENATGKTYVRGYDKNGHILIYMKPALENTNNHDGNIKHLVFSMEKAVACLSKTGKEKLSLIIDYEGFSLFNSPPMKTSRETLTILQDHYPERLYKAYCVRPPYIFYGFYKAISPFIDPVTRNKICMLTNADMNSAHNQLFQEVDQSVLETCVGGHDTRPFNSKSYLTAPFNVDLNAFLNETADKSS